MTGVARGVVDVNIFARNADSSIPATGHNQTQTGHNRTQPGEYPQRSASRRALVGKWGSVGTIVPHKLTRRDMVIHSCPQVIPSALRRKLDTFSHVYDAARRTPTYFLRAALRFFRFSPSFFCIFCLTHEADRDDRQKSQNFVPTNDAPRHKQLRTLSRTFPTTPHFPHNFPTR